MVSVITDTETSIVNFLATFPTLFLSHLASFANHLLLSQFAELENSKYHEKWRYLKQSKTWSSNPRISED